MMAFAVVCTILLTLDGLAQLIKVKIGDDRPRSAATLAFSATTNIALAVWGFTELVGIQ